MSSKPAFVVALAVLLAAACGDNHELIGMPLVMSERLNVIAHQDDDLLFMQPQLDDAIALGTSVTTVYVTAGNGTSGVDYADSRIRGALAAYSTSARAARGFIDWSCGWITIANVPIQHCRLSTAPISLLFVSMPDGGVYGTYAGSLRSLWQHDVDSVTTVAERTTPVTRDSLLALLAAIMQATQPARIDTLDLQSTHGHDHSDHMIVGAATLLAAAEVGFTDEFIAHRGYSVASEPVDLSDDAGAESIASLQSYDACVLSCGECGESACSGALDPVHDLWLHRHYASARRGGVLHGKLSTIAVTPSCLRVNDAAPLAGACSDAPGWTLTASSALQAPNGACVTVSDDGSTSMQPCVGGIAQYFMLDDEGYLWSGLPPVAVADMEFDHLRCLAIDGNVVSAPLCGADASQRWTLTQPVTTMPATAVIADDASTTWSGDLDGDGVVDSCVSSDDGPQCITTRSRADGERRATPWAWSLSANVEFSRALDGDVASSMTGALADVDGDGRADFCELVGSDVLCATSQGDAFGPRHLLMTAAGTPVSLRFVDANGDGRADACVIVGDQRQCALSP